MDPADSFPPAVLTHSSTDEETRYPKSFVLSFPDPPPSAGYLMELLTGLQFDQPTVGGIRQSTPGKVSFVATKDADPAAIENTLRRLLVGFYGLELVVGE